MENHMDHKEQQLRDELKELDSKLQDPVIYSDKKYPKLARRKDELTKILNLYDEILKTKRQIDEDKNLLNNEDKDLAQLAQSEIERLEEFLKVTKEDLNEFLTPQDPNNERDVIMEIRAAAGGDESSLFAGELYRMYSRWAENHHYNIELISESPNEAGGFKEITFAIRGTQAYKNLKFEAGVHRVQRVPVTESQGRIHTSTTTVAVLPEAEETDIEIDPNDLRVDVYRSSGHGGQSDNTTDSAVRITHLPTGLVVTQQDEKSQIKNKAKALGVLRSRLLALKIEEEQKQLSDSRRKLIGSGDRSEKIRTYNFPQDRITDHRIGYSRSNLPAALDGQIDDLIEKLQAAEIAIGVDDIP
jgi:peptide chain release factor 1